MEEGKEREEGGKEKFMGETSNLSTLNSFCT